MVAGRSAAGRTPRSEGRWSLAAQPLARTGETVPTRSPTTAVAALPDTVAAALRPVINATGVLLHTNLGRAPLRRPEPTPTGSPVRYSNLEFDLDTGRRGSPPPRRRTRWPGPAAPRPPSWSTTGRPRFVLALAALAAGRGVVVSRGELVEIGGGFRIPDVMAPVRGPPGRGRAPPTAPGWTTTAEPSADDAALILKVHQSNYRIVGFTETRRRSRRSPASDRRWWPTSVPACSTPRPVADRRSPSWLVGEPAARQTLAAGAALVTFSGDKLLGGPQAGVIAGSPGDGAELIGRLRRHPLARALRVDKLTLAALQATLLGPATPTERALAADPDTLWDRANRLAARLTRRGVAATAVRCDATVGGGGAPGVRLRSAAVALPESYAAALRNGRPAVLAGWSTAGACSICAPCQPRPTRTSWRPCSPCLRQVRDQLLITATTA